MSTVTIWNLDEDVHQALRMRTAEHGRCVEAEFRSTLATRNTKDFDHLDGLELVNPLEFEG